MSSFEMLKIAERVSGNSKMAVIFSYKHGSIVWTVFVILCTVPHTVQYCQNNHDNQYSKWQSNGHYFTTG
jgi:hypothetical protein